MIDKTKCIMTFLDLPFDQRSMLGKDSPSFVLCVIALRPKIAVPAELFNRHACVAKTPQHFDPEHVTFAVPPMSIFCTADILQQAFTFVVAQRVDSDASTFSHLCWSQSGVVHNFQLTT
jgi:hypothetical protein